MIRLSNRFDMSITIRDVARRAGASVSTVSYALNGGPRPVSAAMRARIQAAVAELGYQPNAIARSLKTRSTRTVGIVLPSTTSSFFTAALRGLLAILQEQEYAGLVCESNEDQEIERAHLSELNRRQVDGIVVTPARLAQQDLGYLTTFPAPIVVMDRGVGRSPGDVVAIDNRAGVYEAVALLLREGHRDIALLAGPEGTDTAAARCQGYQAAYAALGPAPPDHLVRWLPFDEDAALRTTRELLALATRPSAIVAGSTRLTVGVLRAIRQEGLHIPRDIALVAYGEVPWADLAVCPLTVVEQRVEELGQAAGRLLVNRLANRNLPRQEVILRPRLVVRESHRRVTQ